MKRRILIASALSALLLLGACGSAAGQGYYSTSQSSAQYENAAGEYDYKAEAVAEEAAEAEAPEASGKPGTEGTTLEEKLVYTCSMRVQTLEYGQTMSAVKKTIKAHQGIIESEQTTDEDYNWYSFNEKTRGTLTSYLTIRVPAAQYEAFLKDIEGTGGKTISKSMSVENITTAYNDQSIRIKALETQEERLLLMMDEAQSVEDMIYIESRLSEVQMELNQARSHLAQMDTDVAYSTVHLTVEEVIQYSKATPRRTFGERIAETFKDSFSNFLGTMEDLLQILIYLLPFLLLIGLILAIVLPLTKKQRAVKRQERKARKAEKKAMKAAQKEAKAERSKVRRAGGEAAEQTAATPEMPAVKEEKE